MTQPVSPSDAASVAARASCEAARPTRDFLTAITEGPEIWLFVARARQ